MTEKTTRVLATVAVAISLVALVLAGYAVYAQQQAEENLREIGQELQRALSPGALPMHGPPPALDLDDT